VISYPQYVITQCVKNIVSFREIDEFLSVSRNKSERQTNVTLTFIDLLDYS